MADEKIRYVLDVDDKGSPKLVKFGDAAKKAGAEAKSSFDQLGEGMQKAALKFPMISGGLADIKSAAMVLKNPLVAIPAALAAGVLMAGKFASANAEAVTELSHLSAQTGMTVNELMAFKRMGAPLGISVETVANASSKLSVNMSKNANALKLLGITAKDPVEAMAQVADKFSKSESATYRARLASEAFGKSWKELAPLLEEGGKKIREASAGGVMTEGMISRYKEIHERTLEIGKTWPKIKAAIGDVASGPLNDMLGIMVDIAKYETAWVSDFRKVQSQKAEINVTRTFTDQFRKTSSHGRAGTTNELDEEKTLTAFKKKSAEERRNILAGVYVDEQSIVSNGLRMKMQMIVTADKRQLEAENAAEEARIKYEEGSDDRKRAREKAKADAEKAMDHRISMYYRELDQRISTEKESADFVAEVDAMQLDRERKDEADAIKAHDKYIEDYNQGEERRKEWAQGVSLEIEQLRDEELKQQTSDLAARLGMHNSTITSMLQEETTFHDGMQKMWQDTGAAIINKMLEISEAWIADMLMRMAFADASRAETVAANGVTAATLTAQDAAPAALAATMSFGSAAVIGGAALAGIIAMAASYDVGAPSVNGNQLANIHDRETILPTWASIPAQRGDWGPAMRFMGQGGSSSTSNTSSQTNHITVNVSGSNASPQAIAQAITRALPIQRRKFAGSSV